MAARRSSKKQGFADGVRAVVARIPRGKTMSYAEVARRAGSPGAARAVGNIMRKNHDPRVPCHRVIKSDGSPGGYNRGSRAKVARLSAEGVRFPLYTLTHGGK